MHNPWPESDPAVMAPVEEHEELRRVVRSVLVKYADHDQVRAAADTEVGYSDDLWRRLNQDLAVGHLTMPEDRGGHGFGVRELAVLLEETGAALLPEPVLVSAVLGCHALAAADDDEFSELLAAAMAGHRVVTVSLGGQEASTMPGSRSASGAAGELVATHDSRTWRLNGVAHAVLQASAADVAILPASGPEGPVLVAVETAAALTEPRAVVDLTRRRGDLRFTDASARLLVGPGRYADVSHRLRLLSQVGVAAEHTGIVAALLDRTRAYVTERHQFGRPIGSFQAIKHRLADVLVDLERARSASRYAAAVLEEDPRNAELAVAVASAVCGDGALRAAHEAVQLHGGMGFTWEHPAHYYLRRVLGDEGLFGPSRERRARIAELVGV